MSAAIVAVLDSEIAALEKELRLHPAWLKLEAAKKLRALYSRDADEDPIGQHESENEDDGPSSRKERSLIKARILKVVDDFFGDSDGPFKAAQLFSAVTNAGLTVPGKDPRNNLSAMLSNSDEFVSTSDGWVRSGSALDPKVAGASDAPTSEAPKSGADTPVNRAPQGAMQFAEGG